MFTGQHDPNGKAFVTLTSGGVKPEGQTFPALYATQQEAEAAYTRQLSQFMADRNIVYVRAAPRVEKISDQFTVWSRLSVA